MSDDFTALAESFRRELRLRNKSERTVGAYLESANRFSAWARGEGIASVRRVGREDVRTWLGVELGRISAQTAKRHLSGVRQWFKWMREEDEITEDPTVGIQEPFVPEKLTQVPSPDSIRRLLKVCSGKTWEDRRDTALILVLMDAGPRASEVIGIQVDDVDLDEQVLIVMGKGRRQRGIPIGRRTVGALDRYMRARSRRKDAYRSELWLGLAGPLTTSGLRQILIRRSEEAGITPHLHPHSFRHFFSDAWLRAGGTEAELMRITGWKSRQMVDRYAAALGADRARQAHRSLSPGDRL